jgi:Holliday junction resolvase-like predicted endonuclease
LLSYKKAPRGEAAYQALFATSLDIMGFNVLNELPTNQGRPDIVITFSDTAIIIEIKYVELDKKAENLSEKAFEKKLDERIEAGIKTALEQIHNKKYSEKFELKYDKVLLIGLVFAQKGQKAMAVFERVK